MNSLDVNPFLWTIGLATTICLTSIGFVTFLYLLYKGVKCVARDVYDDVRTSLGGPVEWTVPAHWKKSGTGTSPVE